MVIELVAILIESTDIPLTLDTRATTPEPLVPSLLNTSSSFTLYPVPPVSIPIFSTLPGLTPLISTVCSKLFGNVRYLYFIFPSIKLYGLVFLK